MRYVLIEAQDDDVSDEEIDDRVFDYASDQKWTDVEIVDSGWGYRIVAADEGVFRVALDKESILGHTDCAIVETDNGLATAVARAIVRGNNTSEVTRLSLESLDEHA